MEATQRLHSHLKTLFPEVPMPGGWRWELYLLEAYDYTGDWPLVQEALALPAPPPQALWSEDYMEKRLRYLRCRALDTRSKHLGLALHEKILDAEYPRQYAESMEKISRIDWGAHEPEPPEQEGNTVNTTNPVEVLRSIGGKDD